MSTSWLRRGLRRMLPEKKWAGGEGGKEFVLVCVTAGPGWRHKRLGPRAAGCPLRGAEGTIRVRLE